ncbi:MAG: hypothetical protein BroJett024_41320 [Alphaproteobacteria bacterium]|nr:MAG: hypothetical protein BroJett024_41320 [Alphaproteobacteria bacterium]
MNRILILIAAALSLAACAGPTAPLSSAPARDTGVIVTATLAPLGSFEWQVAPDYTRLATTRRLAARALTNGRISIATAEQVQVEADAARSALDEAVAAAPRNRAVADSLVAKARESIARAAALLGDAR